MRSHCVLLFLLMPPALLFALSAASHNPTLIGGVSPEEALRLGERMYREGILPSGSPIRGIVEGDIPIDGSMFSCASCHLRSGVGSIEGSIVTLPTNGEWLYKPLVGTEMSATHRERLPSLLRKEFRPAYTDDLLAEALRSGIDAGGRTLNRAMPRYDLDRDEVDILVHYLKNLSSTPSPGVTDTTLRFATVIAEDVPGQVGDAIFAALQAIVNDHNSQTRRQQRRAESGPFYRGESYTSYRRLVLDRWNLTGPRDTWGEQLKSYYSKNPVFALLGGISGGDWSPIHEFCESNGLPAFLPITDFPVVSAKDWYTVYFSKGWYQEAEAVGRYIRSLGSERGTLSVIQAYRDDVTQRRLAEGFRAARVELGAKPPTDVVIAPAAEIGERWWDDLAAMSRGAILVLWLDAADLAGIGRLSKGGAPPDMLFLSARLAKPRFDRIPAELVGRTYLTHPYALPNYEKKVDKVASHWLKSRGVEVDDATVRAQLYFTGWMLSNILKQLGGDFYRDYFLDVIDMMRDEHYSIGCYPRVSFGPGQRYIAKGCYIVQRVGEGAEARLVPRSTWVIH